MPRALEHIRRMRGGAQAHLLRCNDGQYYVVKFQNNPQAPRGGRILANELLGTRIAARLGLPTPEVAVIDVPRELIDLTAELAMEIGVDRVPCRPGLQFGSRHPGIPAQMAVHDFLPDEQLDELENLADFAGMLVFDKLVCNTNGRQAIFFQEPGCSRYRSYMIDQGFCFNAGEWSFPDAPLRGIYSRDRVYRHVTGMDSFEPWLSRAAAINSALLDEIAREIPPEWFEDDQDALFRLLEQLERRQRRVPDLLLDARDCHRRPFPNWT